MSRISLGVDLGGTRIKLCAVDESGTLRDHRETATADDGSATWRQAVRDLVRAAEATLGQPADTVGLAAPGLAAASGRAIDFMPGRLQGLEGLDWSVELGRPVAVLNDAHAFVLGEAWLGAARGCRHVVGLTLGTGVGGGVISHGALLLGHRQRAGHLGHLSLDPEGDPDCTGVPGGLEDWIGEQSLPRRSGGRFTTTRDLLAAVADGDADAAACWRKSVRALAAAVASLINLFDPERVVIGGGIAQAGPALFEPLEQRLREIEWHIGFPVPVFPAELGPHAGAIGAARHAFNERERK